MDRDSWGARTDNIVVVDAATRSLLWVPRDLWCRSLGDRVNTAFARGGHPALVAALGEHGLSVDHSLCLRRSAVERVLERLAITVPVAGPLDLLYPLTPCTRLEDGRKVVSFRPPEARLEGERVHQWIGARTALSGDSGDLARIRRQHVFVRRLLEEGVDVRSAIADPERVRISGAAALAEVASVRADWAVATFDRVAPAVRGGREVLIARRSLPAALVPGSRRPMLSRAAARVLAAVEWRWRQARQLLIGIARVPSAGLLPPRRRVRLLAVVAVRDEMTYLPGFLANVAPHVDGIVALDDGSTDGSAELLEGSPHVLEVLRVPCDRPGWDEVGNFVRLHAAALGHGAEWLLAVDADERLERRFRERAERVIRRGRRLGLAAFAVRLRDLWGAADTWRCDGLWGTRRVPRLFAALAGHRFDYRPLHAVKAPLQARVLGRFVTADLVLYHRRMIGRDDREARRARYLSLDPDARCQPELGYDYLTDETGLRLRRVPRRRGFVEGTGADAG